jgi:hypothetical protein
LPAKGAGWIPADNARAFMEGVKLPSNKHSMIIIEKSEEKTDVNEKHFYIYSVISIFKCFSSMGANE